MRRAVFLDLNGTLVLPILVTRLSALTPIPGASEAVARLSSVGFVCPVVTIQSRIAKGYFSLTQFETWFAGFAEEFKRGGASLIGPYVCPHRFADPCACKKPQTTLYEQAATDHGLILDQSFVIGDSTADVEAAARFGGRGCLVRTGWGEEASEIEKAKPFAACIVPSMHDAVTWVLETQLAGRRSVRP